MSKPPISETDLHAYVDAQLPESRWAEVAEHLLAHPEEAGRVQAYRSQKNALRELFDPLLDEALPATLRQLAEAPPAAVDPKIQPILTRWSLQRIAAGIVIATLGGVAGWLARGRPESNYFKQLAFTGALDLERGMRAELEQKQPLTALYRNRKTVLGLVGARDRATGEVQYPRTSIAVGSRTAETGTLEDYPLAERVARILTYTADSLAYTPDPPGCYGMLEFEGGGRMLAEFTDVDPAAVEVGLAMRMTFRIKAVDERRDFTKYFWKAAPAA